MILRADQPPGLTQQQAAFRIELREVLSSPRSREELARYRQRPPRAEAGHLDIYRQLGSRGMLAPSWPTDVGGLGLGPVEAAILTEELTLTGIPDDLHVLSIDIVGAFLLKFGTSEQQRRILPGLAAGTSAATVLFSEPGCGSDLSALTTTAAPHGDGWRVSGQKLYTQKSQFAEFGILAARTRTSATPMDGITLFLLPFNTAGVHLEPVANLSDDTFLRVTIDGVVLDDSEIVGTLHDGWNLIGQLLSLERTGIDFHGKARRLLNITAQLIAEHPHGDQPDVRSRLAALDAELAASHALAWQQVANQVRGQIDDVASAASKWCATRCVDDILRLARDVLGMDSMLSRADTLAPLDGLLEELHRVAPSYQLASGTSEIMLNIIASQGLRLA